MRRVVVFFIALTLLAPAARGATLYRCGHSAALRDHCCCAHQPSKPRGSSSEVRPGCCCETVHIDAPRMPSRQCASVSLPSAAFGPTEVAVAVVQAKPRAISFARWQDPLAPPIPLFVAHCALLR